MVYAMQFNSAFACGDHGWVVNGAEVRHLTIGRVQITETHSPGTTKELYSNYSAQDDYSEEYMCVETGVGSGDVYTLGKDIFTTEAAAVAASTLAVERRKAERASLQERKDLDFLARENYLRNQLADIEELKAEKGYLTFNEQA